MVFLGRTKKIHFVGIGGIGMSGIAEVLVNLGFSVSGSDLRASDTTRRLVSLGVRVAVGHDGANCSDADVVVYSSAVDDTNPEVAAAIAAGIPVIPRAEMLAELMRLKFAVTVGGSHGKTSTTSLVAAVLDGGGLDPTVIVGGKIRSLRTNARLGGGRYLVAEADESDGSFIGLPSTIAVITNIDREHLDHYGNLEGIKQGFVDYANRVPFYGAVVLCADDANTMDIGPRIARRRITYSLDGQADVTAEVVSRDPSGTKFHVVRGRSMLGTVALKIPGDHYVRNALAAIAVGLEMEIPFDSIRLGLEGFAGVGRRFEVRGEVAGVTVVDDYGHHPTEIAATIRAARGNFSRPVIVLFQPHRFSRTQSLFEQFGSCFDGAAHVVITDIYPAGEDPIAGVDAQLIVESIRRSGEVPVTYVKSFEGMVDALEDHLMENAIVIIMGAGSISQVPALVLDRLGQRGKRT